MKNLPSNDVSVPEELGRHDVVLLDKEDPRALINLVPARFKDAIINLAENYEELLTESEVELKETVKPDVLDDRLRVAFWHEYVSAQDSGRRLKLGNVYSELCSDKHFYTKILPNHSKIAWIICRPANYMMSLEASLNNGKNTLDKIMRMNIFNEEGELHIQKAKIFLQAYELLDNRVRGSVIQRIEQKTQTVHLRDPGVPSDKDELEKLRAEQGTIDVTPKPQG